MKLCVSVRKVGVLDQDFSVWVRRELTPPPHKNQIFQGTPSILKFFICNPITSFKKATKFLVKISEFTYLLSYERKTFLFKHFFFCCQTFQILVYFCLKTVTPWKSHSPLSKQPLFKSCRGSSLFENLVRGSEIF